MSHIDTAPTHTHEFTSDEVKVTVHHKSGCRIEMVVFAAPSLIQTAQKTAIKNVGKEIQLPGFRKGKAPSDVILKKFPADVEKSFHKELADLSFTAAHKLTNLPLLNNNSKISFELKSQSEESAELHFGFETEPTVPSVDVQAFQVKSVDRSEITDIQIDEAIRQMQFFYAHWKKITDRPIQDGDYIVLSLETIEDDVPQKVFDQIRFEVSKARMADWMKKLVEGAKSGDVLEGVSEPDENASEEEKKTFQPKRVRLTIHKVEEAELPPLGDEFAKKVGTTDVANMREMVSKILNEKSDEKMREELREQVNDFLVQNYTFDLPESLVETEKRDRIKQSLLDPKNKSKWDSLTQEERQKMEESIKNEASHAISLFYLSRKIVNDAQIPITQKEVQQEAIATLNSIRGDRKVDTIPKEVYALALSKVLLAKAQDYIIQANTQKA